MLAHSLSTVVVVVDSTRLDSVDCYCCSHVAFYAYSITPLLLLLVRSVTILPPLPRPPPIAPFEQRQQTEGKEEEEKEKDKQEQQEQQDTLLYLMSMDGEALFYHALFIDQSTAAEAVDTSRKQQRH